MVARPAIPIITIWFLLSTAPASADPAMECSTNGGSQVEIGQCVAEVENTVDLALEIALEFAMDAAKELDDVTGREVAAPALEVGQSAWSEYRDKHCEYVGATFGGGSGTGVAIRSCRIALGRARTDELMQYAR